MAPHLPWLARLHEILRKVRLPVGDLVLTDNCLEIELVRQDSNPLRVLVRPIARDREGFARTSRFVVGFEGGGMLDTERRNALSLLVEVLRRIEGRLPPTLEGAGAVFTHESSEEDRFLRVFRFCTIERSRARDREITELLVRTTSSCNQRCPFCSAPDHATPSASTLAAMIREAARVIPGVMLSLTGGEPTLRSSFADELRLALELDGIARVQVQTNGVAFDRKVDPRRFAPTPRLAFFVSLHALDAMIYDRCTGTTGQLDLALKGIRNLLQAGHAVTINCVISSANIDHLDDYVRGLAERFPSNGPVDLHFSTLICPETRPEAQDFLVPYPTLATRLRSLVPVAEAHGVMLQSLRSSTHAAMPPCLLAPEERERDAHRPRILAHETGFEDYSRPWIKAVSCRECAESGACLGVPRPYARRFGLMELRPIRKT